MTASTALRVHDTAPATASTRRTATLVGILFLTATVTFLIADRLILDVLDRPNYLSGASADAGALTTAALLAFVDGLAIVGIALLFYPLLRRYSESLALGYVGFRVAELAGLLVYLATPLLVVEIGNALRDGTLDPAAGQYLGGLFRAQYTVSILMVYLFTSTAGTILATLLYRSQLVPRPLAILGVIGYPVLLAGSVLAMFDVITVTEGIGVVAVVPGGLFELVLPIWLIFKGFMKGTA